MHQPVFPRESFEKGRQFLSTRARALDRERFAAAIGQPARVVEALASYQNADGGFGHAIEPDLRTPLSTAIATSVGFQALKEARIPATHPVVRRGVSWLLAKLDRDRLVWPIVSPASAQAPHAPWWTFSADMDERWNMYRYNPSADLFGMLCHYRALVPTDVLADLTSAFGRRLKTDPPKEVYDLYCCVRLHDSDNLPESLREPLARAILELARSQDPESFHVNYFELVPSPRSLLYPTLAAAFGRAVANAIETQESDGSWKPGWNWAEQDAAAWKTAEIEWRGVLTRTTLQSVHRHRLVA